MAKKGYGPNDSATTDFAYKSGSGAIKDVGLRLNYAGEEGPNIAKAFRERYADLLTSDDAQLLDVHIDTRQRSLDTAARAAAAQQAAEARQLRTQINSQIEGTIWKMNNGGGTDQEVADATHAAVNSNDARLVDELGKAVTTRNVNRTYANYTPVQLQPEIDSLAAKVRSAAVMPTSNDTVTLAAMRSLQDKTTAEINRSPLSFAADRLGLPIPPIKLE